MVSEVTQMDVASTPLQGMGVDSVMGQTLATIEPLEHVGGGGTGDRPEFDHWRVNDLVVGIRNGDQAFWPELIETFEGMIRRTASGLGVSGSLIDDVLQDTFIILFNHIDRIETPERLAGWLHTTAVRASLKQLRRSNGRTVAYGDNSDGIFDRIQPHHDPDIAEGLLWEERRNFLRDSLPELTHKQQLLAKLLIESDMGYKEIAAALDVHIGAIGPRRGRIIEKLKDLVTDDLVDPDVNELRAGRTD